MCSNDSEVEVFSEDCFWRDHETTPDQKRIVELFSGWGELSDLIPKKPIVLHVGIGNSSLYESFKKAKLVHGITNNKCEFEHGKELAKKVENYKVDLVDKYSPRYETILKKTYDFVVDNNP